MRQPLPCQHEQLRCQNFFVMNLQNGLRMIRREIVQQELLSLSPGGCQWRAVSALIMTMCNLCSSVIFCLLPKFSIQYDSILSLVKGIILASPSSFLLASGCLSPPLLTGDKAWQTHWLSSLGPCQAGSHLRTFALCSSIWGTVPSAL